MGEHYVIFGIPIPNQLNREINRCPACQRCASFSWVQIGESRISPFCIEHREAAYATAPVSMRDRLPQVDLAELYC